MSAISQHWPRLRGRREWRVVYLLKGSHMSNHELSIYTQTLALLLQMGSCPPAVINGSKPLIQKTAPQKPMTL